MISAREAVLMDLVEALVETHDAGEDMGRKLTNVARFVAEIRRVEGIPDTLPAGWNRPAPATMEDVHGALREAAMLVYAGDSFEGTITWTMPTDEPELEGFDFGLVARYRVGNSMGQGGLHVFEHRPDAGT
jgi:hypothetical protein